MLRELMSTLDDYRLTSFTLLIALALGLISVNNRRIQHRELTEHRQLISQYTKFIDGLKPGYAVSRYEEDCEINYRGDTRNLIRLSARVLSADLQFIRLSFGCGWLQPPRHRRRVRLDVRSLLVDGSPGTSLKRTSTWVQDGRVDIIVHFPSPPAKGSQISLSIELLWPGKCAPLMRQRHPEEFAIKFKLPVAYARYSITLPVGCAAYFEPIEGNGLNGKFQAYQSDGDQPRFAFEAFDVPLRRRVGVRLELKERSARTSKTRALVTRSRA